MSKPLVPFMLLLLVALMATAGTIAWARRRSRLGSVASDLYGSIVAQARRPHFYAVLGVADTIEGRFEMMVLHLVLALERLRGEAQAGQALGRALIERFVADMDDQMREIGIGDLAVPRRIQKTAAALQERVEDYRAGLAAADRPEMLRDAVARHVTVGRQGIDAAALAAYMRACGPELAGQPLDDLLAGTITFPVPGAPT